MEYQDLLIEKATTEDGPGILELLKSRAADLKRKGSEQWSFLLTGQEDDEIAELVSKGFFYKVTSRERSQASPRLAAAFMLSDIQEEWDVHLWGHEDAQDTVYLHKLAVAFELKGQGLGDHLIDWIKQQVEKLGYTKIRLDCVAHSDKLQSFYGKHDFELLSLVDGHCLYEWESNKQAKEVHNG